MPFVPCEGASLWYQRCGAGQPIVLCGGFGLLHRQWDGVRSLLSKRFDVIDWHYRGSGLSTRSIPAEAFCIDRWVDDLHAIVAHLGLEPIVLWGTSTGSPLAIRYAMRYPEHVSALITYPSFRGDEATARALKVFGQVGETFGLEAMAILASWLGCADELMFTRRWAKFAQWEASCFADHLGPVELAHTLNAFSSFDFGSQLGTIRAPTLVLMGGSGRLGYAASRGRALLDDFRTAVPHAQAATVDGGGGTYCMLDRPRDTVAAITSFLQALPAAHGPR